MQYLPLLLLISIIGTYLYFYFKRRYSFFSSKGIPSPPVLPLFGNIAPLLFRRKNISQCLWEFHNFRPDAKYIGIYTFLDPVILIHDHEIMKDVGIKYAESFPERADSAIETSVEPLFGGMIGSLHGDEWKEARGILSPTFTSSKIKAAYSTLVEVVNNMMVYCNNLPDEKLAMVDTKELFQRYTNDIIAICAYGTNVNSFDNPKNDFYKFGRASCTFDGPLSYKVLLYRSFPSILSFFRVQLIETPVANFFKRVIGDIVKTRDETGYSRPDMIQLMIEARNKGTKYLKLGTLQMTAHAFIFYLAGFETTASQMCCMAHELALNPDIQAKLQEEVDEVYKSCKGNFTYDIIQDMPYMEAVLRESLRRHVISPLIDRVCVKEFELPPALPGGKPHVMKPGDRVWIPANAVHLDPKNYEDPLKFDPMRYLNDVNKKIVNNSDVMNMGFGIGPRGCIGSRFAIVEIKLLFCHLLSHFTLVRNAKTDDPLQYSKRAITISPANGFWLSLKRRENKLAP